MKKSIDLQKYNLIIFDFDGVVADSLGIYRELDRLLIKDLYGIDESVENLDTTSKMIKTGTINNSEDDYYRYLDKVYGNGQKPLTEIWDKIFELAPIVQSNIKPKYMAIDALVAVKKNTRVPIALSTSSSRSDIDFFSSNKSKIGRLINLNEFFNKIVTFDDVKKPKPDPESFQKIINFYDVEPGTVLIFEDSLSGILAGKKAGAVVFAIEDLHNEKNKDEIIKYSDAYFEDWEEFLNSMKKTGL